MTHLLSRLWSIDLTPGLIYTAGDVAEMEALRGYDALHLAAALVVGADVMTSADSALCAAASRHGIAIANPLDVPDA